MTQEPSHDHGRDEVVDREEFFKTYFARLLPFARMRIRNSNLRVSDEEDIALSVLKSIFNAAAKGRVQLNGEPSGIWKLLCVMTDRKAVDYRRHEHRDKRGGGRVRGESVFNKGGDMSAGLHQIIDQRTGCHPSMESGDSNNMLDKLGDESLKRIAMLRVEGYSNDEISKILNVSIRTIERKARLIRRIWIDEGFNQ